jgi:hypothetical protein
MLDKHPTTELSSSPSEPLTTPPGQLFEHASVDHAQGFKFKDPVPMAL